jgi:hypothetical protein
MNNRKMWISNLLMSIILLIVGIKHAINLFSIELLPISTQFITDVIFIFSILLFILIVTMVIFYLPMLVIIQFEFQLNIFLTPIIHGSSLFRPLQKQKFISKRPVYLIFCVIRC